MERERKRIDEILLPRLKTLSSKTGFKMPMIKDYLTEIEDNLFFKIILRRPHTCRDDRDAIMICHFLIRSVCYWILILPVCDDPCFKIIGNQQTGNAIKILEHPDMAVDPVLDLHS